MRFINFTIILILLALSIGNAKINVANIISSDRNPKTKMLAKTLVVRYKIQSKDEAKLLSAASSDYKIVAEILPKDLSIHFNSKLMKDAMDRKLDIQEILKAEEPLLRTFIIEYNSDLSPEAYSKHIINKHSDIELAEPYYIPSLQSYTPNDQFLSLQPHLNTIKAYEAWGIEKGKPTVIIGVSDNGVLYDHKDLENSIALNTNEIPDNEIDDDNNGFIDDYYGYNLGWEYNELTKGDPAVSNDSNHGTNVAGVLGATTDNQIGIAGVGFNCKICPIKIDSDGKEIPFAYQSLLYAAIRGVSVLNMSWGSEQPYSYWEMSMIKLAQSYDIALVAAAGNIAPGETFAATYYPSAYPGVLGVGMTNDADIVLIDGTTVGMSCDIFAPSDIFTTDINYNYKNSGPGTSFSTPVVSGAVALVRSHFPDLKGEQALEVVRQNADDISQNNTMYTIKKLIPGRLNIYKALSADPFSIPGIKLISTETFDTKGIAKQRFLKGDTVIIRLNIKNLLGAANNLNFALSEAYADVDQSIKITKAQIPNINVTKDEEFTLSEFKLVINESVEQNIIMRVDITGDNNYKDFFKFLFIPGRFYTDFQNEQLQFSLSDNGDFGFNSNLKENNGYGFAYYRFSGNQLYKKGNGLVATYGGTKAAYSFNNDFVSTKGFDGEDYNTGIVQSQVGTSQNQLGLEIKQKAGFVSNNSKSAKIELEIKNISQQNINDVSVGYFLDFDLYDLYELNSTMPFPQGVPEEFKNTATAQILKSNIKPAAPFNKDFSEYPVFGLASISNEANVHPQAAGLNSSISADLNYASIIKALTSGTSWQIGTNADISAVIGMGFEGVLAPEQVKKCAVCFAVGRDEEDLANELQICLKNQVPVKDFTNNQFVAISPNPAHNAIQLEAKCAQSYSANVKIYDIFGKVVVQRDNLLTKDGYFNENINISDLPVGCYVVYIEFNNSEFIYSKFIKVD